jgi:hypothetical protein
MTTINNEKFSFPKNSIDDRELIKLDIKLKSGSYLIGTFTSIRDKDFDFLTMDGAKTTINFENVDYFHRLPSALSKIIHKKLMSNTIIKSDEKESDDSQNKNKSEIVDSAKNYKKIGLALGTPGGLNFVYGYSNRNLCFHFSVGVGDRMHGIQIGPGFDIFSNKNFEINLLVNFLYINIKDREFRCIAILPDINIYGFHLQFGAGFGNGDWKSPQNLFQIGYVYRYGK